MTSTLTAAYHELAAVNSRLRAENEKLCADCLRLWLAIDRIGGLNDSPSHFNPDIDLVITRLINDPELGRRR